MPKRVLILTKDPAEFETLCETFVKSDRRRFESIDFFSLESAHLRFDHLEVRGEITERAHQLARQAHRELRHRADDRFDAVLAVWEGLAMRGETHRSLQKAIQTEVRSGALQPRQTAYLKRAFYLIHRDGREEHFVAKIPLLYKEPSHPLKKRDYRLSRLFATATKNDRLSTLSRQELAAYFAFYCSRQIKTLGL